jgi:hypothetical protein
MRVVTVTAVVATLFMLDAAIARPWKEPRDGKEAIPYSRVADALKALKVKKGVVVSGNEERGFLVTEADQRTQWQFTPFKHPAHPAVVRRIARVNSDERSEVAILCERKSPECDQLLRRYKSLDELSGVTALGLNSASSSVSYADKIRAAIRPHIVQTEEIDGNPVAEIKVTTNADGEIIDTELVVSSGNPSWDRAVRIAVIKAGRMPLDVNGKVPKIMTLAFRPKP